MTLNLFLYFYWDIVKYLFKLSTHALFIAEKMWKVRISKIKIGARIMTGLNE